MRDTAHVANTVSISTKFPGKTASHLVYSFLKLYMAFFERRGRLIEGEAEDDRKMARR